MLIVIGIGEGDPRDVVRGFRDQAQIVGSPVRGDEHVGVEAWRLRFQNDQRGGLLAFSVERRSNVPAYCVANVRLAHDFFAGFHLDDADAQRRAHHGGHTSAIRIQDAAI